MTRIHSLLCILGAIVRVGWAQEANSGFDLRTTLSSGAVYTHQLAQQPRSGAPVAGGFRSVLYPTWKLSRHWTISGAVQVHSRPYFSEEFTTQGYGVKTDVLAAHLSYSRICKDRSLIIRVGEMPSSFGSFLTHYDDSENPLIDVPLSYGYYYKPVSVSGLAGAQVDTTIGRFDARGQFVNSSPANRRSVFDREQYGNWSGGAGYTIWQGFRIGASAYHGPYLHRQYAFYFRGEAKPRDLAGSAIGIDIQWGAGHWNLSGEWQRFRMDYRAIPVLVQQLGYAEGRRVLHPRWYIAARAGYQRASAFPGREVYESVIGFRPTRHHLVKLGYKIQHGPAIRGTLGNSAAIQFITMFRAISIAKD